MQREQYTTKQQLLQQYRSNLAKLEREIAAYGGYDYAPLITKNQYDQAKEDISRLENEIKHDEFPYWR